MKNPLAFILVISLAVSGCSSGSVSGPDGAPEEPGAEPDAGLPDGGGDPLAPDGGDVGGADPAGDSGDAGQDAGADAADGGDAGPAACGEIATFESGKTPARFVHVAEDGSDSTGDGSAERPFATIGRAARGIAPGTAVVIHAGTYPGGAYLENLRGSANSPIWIGGAAGEARPVIEGGGEAMHLVGPRYLVLHDLEVRNTTANGINCDDGGEVADPEAARFLVFRNLDVHDVGGDGNQDCLKLSGLNDYWVLSSRFARCGGAMSGSGIDHVGCHRGLIANCRFEENSGNAVQCKGGSTDIDIVRCVFDRPGERAVNMGGSTGFEYFRPPLSPDAPNAEARRIRVQANLVLGGTAALAFVGCVDCLAAHNTIVGPGRWLIRILQETVSASGYVFEPCRDNAVVNNIFFFERAVISTHVNIGANTSPETFSFAGNLWFAHDDPARSAPSLPSVEDAGLSGQDPAFENPSGGDYHIGAESPAAGSGVSWPGAADADLAGRCYRAPPSRGAYEVR
ncbi:MAG: DUF5123 domain-containing protein [Myxococcales bacterium]|nr:DUF5123 domain-containing protein [Myxococcales bacterium]